MSISATTGLSKPIGDSKISSGLLGYISARNRQEVYNIIIREFKKSGLTQAQVARRLGQSPVIISRLFNRPRNLEIDTLSELLFAICGAAIKLDVAHPRATALEHSKPASSTRKASQAASVVIFSKKGTSKGTDLSSEREPAKTSAPHTSSGIRYDYGAAV